VMIHPSSVNFGTAIFSSPWLIYFEKVMIRVVINMQVHFFIFFQFFSRSKG
jgi:hypothetical protein